MLKGYLETATKYCSEVISVTYFSDLSRPEKGPLSETHVRKFPLHLVLSK